MQLHDNPFSPYAYKVRVVLYEKGVPFEKLEVYTEEDRKRLLGLNPRGEVPALVDGDAVICDSKVICAYLEQKFPEPALVPADPVARARCQFLELKFDTDVDASVLVLATIKLFRSDLATGFPDALSRAEEILATHYAALERELAGRDWLVGDSFSLADAALAPHIGSAVFMGYAIGPEHPALAAWSERILERPSVQNARREMAEGFAKARSVPNFESQPLHWRNDRIECALRCGLGRWLLDEFESGGAFLSPLS